MSTKTTWRDWLLAAALGILFAWFLAAKNLLAIIGAFCVLGFVGAIFQRNF